MSRIRSVINNYAPVCAIPGCINRVKYRRSYLKTNNMLGARWHNCCDKHNTTLKIEKDKYMKSCVKCGCTDRDCLTIDHIDGNRHNNDISNKQILCANCHQKKTKENKDHLNKYTYTNTKFDDLFEFFTEDTTMA